MKAFQIVELTSFISLLNDVHLSVVERTEKFNQSLFIGSKPSNRLVQMICIKFVSWIQKLQQYPLKISACFRTNFVSQIFTEMRLISAFNFLHINNNECFSILLLAPFLSQICTLRYLLDVVDSIVDR